MTILEDAELGRLVRQMPAGAMLRRSCGYWLADAPRGNGSRLAVWRHTPEEALRAIMETVESEPVGRDAWTMEGPE